jgi:hypothetical protein
MLWSHETTSDMSYTPVTARDHAYVNYSIYYSFNNSREVCKLCIFIYLYKIIWSKT